MGDIKKAFAGFGRDLLDDIRANHSEVLDDAAFEERIKGIQKATAAMKEAKIPNEKIAELLQKYWDLRPSDARSFL